MEVDEGLPADGLRWPHLPPQLPEEAMQQLQAVLPKTHLTIFYLVSLVKRHPLEEVRCHVHQLKSQVLPISVVIYLHLFPWH